MVSIIPGPRRWFVGERVQIGAWSHWSKQPKLSYSFQIFPSRFTSRLWPGAAWCFNNCHSIAAPELLNVMVMRLCDRAKFCRVCTRSWDFYTQTRKVIIFFTIFTCFFWQVFTPFMWHLFYFLRISCTYFLKEKFLLFKKINFKKVWAAPATGFPETMEDISMCQVQVQYKSYIKEMECTRKT